MNKESSIALSDLKVGQSGHLEQVSANSESEIRMLAMGFLPGDKITILSRSVLGGPVSIEHQGQGRYAIRNNIAKKIKVKTKV